jgi:uncharacterized surface protein with fasciclin (FAS1) repeats
MSKTRYLLVGLAAAGVALLSACGSDSTAGTSSAASTSSAAASTTSSAPMSSSMSSSAPMSESSMSGSSMASSGDAMAAALVGPGCADYAAAVPTGAGSVDGMAQDPVATAASNNPLLTTLVKAVSGQVNPKVDLVTTLNGGEFTVFAPVDSAFAKIDAATMTTLGTDDALLSKILTYHVVPGQIAPDAIVGTHTTVAGETLEVTGSGGDLEINGTSAVICGGVKTANATVYLIDTVLMPPAA